MKESETVPPNGDPNGRPWTASLPGGPGSAAAPSLWAESEAVPPIRGRATASTVLSLDVLLRYKGTIALVFLAVSGSVIACIWLLIAPMFRATAAVYVSPIVPRLVYKSETSGVMPLYRQHLNTQAHLLRSPEVLERVLNQERVKQTNWYRQAPKPLWGDPPSHLDRLREEVEVMPSGESEVISVSMRTRAPQEAKRIVDAVVEEYEKVSRMNVGSVEAQVHEKVKEEFKQLTDEIAGLDQVRYNLSKEVGTLAPEELRSQRSTHLSVLEAKRAEIERRLALTRYELEFLPQSAPPERQEKGKKDAEPQPPPPPERRYTRDAEWRQLNIALQSRRHDLELAQMRYGDAHPKLAEIRAEVEHAERLRSQREAQLDEEQGWIATLEPEDPPMVLDGIEPPPNSPAALQRNLRLLERELGLLDKDIDRQRALVASAGDVAQRLAEYDEVLRYKRADGELFRTRLQGLETESKAPLHIRVFPASEPSQPDRDRRLLFTIMALAMGLMSGLGVAYLRCTLDPTIREAGDVPIARAPFLGRLPAWSDKTDLLADSNALLLEYTRMVRTALLERLNGTEHSVLLITSCSSRSGKTGVAVLLARSLAQLGKRVLLVEADLHRPSLTERLRLPNGPGLMSVLCGRVRDQDAMARTEIPRLDVLPAGDHPPEFDPELMANGEFAACLRRWRSTYNFVLLDSPPVLPVADARILARHADGTLMVLRSSHCRKPDVVQAYADLGAAGATLLGTVLVGAEPVHDAYTDVLSRSDEPRRLLEI